MNEQHNLPKNYEPQEVEKKWYRFWEEQGYFAATMDPEKPSFSIVMPPPNVTGKLHMGHAMDNTLQDILVRYKRLQNFNVLWVPGTDHAGIATQAKVEAQLQEEGLSRYDIGRDAFLERAWAWKEKYGNTITQQLRELGTSCDWSRERFTMDAGCSEAVREAFVSWYEQGLIYQGNYIVNWCPNCATTISDIEVEHVENQGEIYHLAYPLEDGAGHLIIATTRPETMFGDTAVAVNPADERYQGIIGKHVVLPVINKKIPVIADDYVDMSFGTGAVKITPAHDVNDFEVGKRHQLPEVVIIDKKGHMTGEVGPYAGLDRYACRKQLVADLQKSGVLVKVEEHVNAVGHCYRCDTIVEPLVSKQWFVNMAPLAKPAIEAVAKQEVRFVPERFTKIYLGWLENIRDWCISRQLWWGHRIPVWYCQSCGEVICTREDPTACPTCQSHDLIQDPDVLDTWFSSGLWPFSTMGWPEETAEMDFFYPTTALVTGRDIIFFWVARMIFAGYAFTGKSPFQDVLIHGLVLDANGKKMSKSLGNGIDPLEIIETYGADVMRFMLITGNTPGSDLKFQTARLDATRNFANKIWNAARFVLMNLADYVEPSAELQPADEVDAWIISRFYTTVGEVTKHLEAYDFGEAGRVLYEFIWNEFCDWYIELVKPRLYGKETERGKLEAQYTCNKLLRETMILLHPFMPFITEEIWQSLSHQGDSIMHTGWPQYDEAHVSNTIESKMGVLMETVKGIRTLRQEMNIPLGKKITLIIACQSDEQMAMMETLARHLTTLVGAEDISIVRQSDAVYEQVVTIVVAGMELFLPLSGLLDIDQEIARLEKEMIRMDQEIQRVEKKLANQGFLAKAPQEVVESEKEKLAGYVSNKIMLEKRIGIFKA